VGKRNCRSKDDDASRFWTRHSFFVADFKKLQVWQKAHALAVNVNKIGGALGPTHSSLRSQMIRAAMSIDANITEGRSQPIARKLIAVR